MVATTTTSPVDANTSDVVVQLPGVERRSPIASVDPMVRALNTLMYGLLVHCGTFWMYGLDLVNLGKSDHREVCVNDDSIAADMTSCLLHESSSSSSSSWSWVTSWIWCILLLHEYWVYLQHSNVLANPYCQRLDRQYGIALLKSNQHWAIAGTLSAYWCRESLCMFLCLPFLPTTNDSYIKYWITYSLVYHTIKSRGIRQDALRRFSPTFGIMRVVIDKFYFHTQKETLLTLVRLFLQGFDTYIHHAIIKELLFLPTDSLSSSSTMTTSSTLMNPDAILWLHILFGIWVFHAALNQYFRCSTASIMVHLWHSMTAQRQSSSTGIKTPRTDDPSAAVLGTRHDDDDDNGHPKVGKTNDDYHATTVADEDDVTEAESVSSHGSTSDSDDDGDVHVDRVVDQDFIVRKLLRKGRLSKEMEGRQGTATDGVNTAIRIETACTILTTVFILGLNRMPLRALGMDYHDTTQYGSEGESMVTLVLVSWLLGNLLYGIWIMFLRGVSSRTTSTYSSSKHGTKRVIRNLLDLIMFIVTATHCGPSRTRKIAWSLALGVTMKSYLMVPGVTRPKVFATGVNVLEFGGKLILLRGILAARETNARQMALVESLIAIVWALWVISSPVPTPCELASNVVSSRSEASSVADVVFLGHPAELVDCWALWLLPYSLEERWTGPFWTIPLWPLHYLVGLYTCKYRRRFFGDGASFFCCDDVYFGGTRMQTWTASHFGRHFVTHPVEVKRNIEAAARHAEKTGVRVLCLGALNKAESINGGGVGVVKALGENRKLSVIHGNHLTAAAVVETTVKCFGQNAKVFLTGASSKVGWAVAQALRDRYEYTILCHSTDAGRRKFFEEQGFLSSSKLSDGTHFSPLWIVGKYDLAVPTLIPQNATAVVFSVPHSLGARSDVRVIEAGTLHLDLTKLDRPRQFANKLKGHEIFACHAASIVAKHRLQRDGLVRIDETGPVDPVAMDSWLKDAKELGLHVPYVAPVTACGLDQSSEKHPVIVVGTGPSGLAVAASLVRKGVRVVILERQSDSTQFGSWEHHFTGIEITTQKKWCNLPWFPIPSKEFPGETITAKDYCRYLQLYASRFGLEIRRGIHVASIVKGENPLQPWIVSYTTGDETNSGSPQELFASAVVVATGKHRVPKRDTNDNLCERLSKSGIRVLHSSELRDYVAWDETIQAAQKGRLAIVGFGNSASDVATTILKHCPNSNTAHIHIAARTVPPVFPRSSSIFRVDTIGYYLSRLSPSQLVEDLGVKLLWSAIPSSRMCNAAFPTHLPRWSRIHGRVPVIDKCGAISSGFQSGRLVGHGPVIHVDPGTQSLVFDDHTHAMASSKGSDPLQKGAVVAVDMVIIALGYCKTNSLVTRADPLNGLYTCGFGNDRFLPLRSIGDEAQKVADKIATEWANSQL